MSSSGGDNSIGQQSMHNDNSTSTTQRKLLGGGCGISLNGGAALS